MNTNIRNRVGETNGMIEVIDFHGLDKKQNAIWLCRCQCGRLTKVKGYHIKNTVSCGCLRISKLVDRVTTHGGTKNGWSGNYRTWAAMRDRCGNPNAKSFKWYGGRGITVCEQWRHDFAAFEMYLKSTIGDRPNGLTIDRINNYRGYEPGNVRWATRKEQMANRRPLNNTNDLALMQAGLGPR